jgi:hypothetical protein
MYRFLLAFLVFSSVVVCLATLIVLGTASTTQLTPPELSKAPTHAKLGGTQDYTQQKMDISLSYPVRIAANSLGLVAGLVSLYFLYRKKHKGSKVMYFPLLVALASFGMFLYNLINLSTNVSIFQALDNDLNILNVKTPVNAASQESGIMLDIGSSALGLLAQAGTFFYLLNRRV